MQIREQIDQFTKPLQGRLLPSNVILFGFYFLGLHLLVNHLFFNEIASLTDKVLIKGFWDIFKQKYSGYFDLLLLLISAAASYAIFSRFWKGYLFASLSIYIAWTVIFLYLSLWDCGLWHIKPIYSLNFFSYLDVVDLLLVTSLSLILFPKWSFIFKFKIRKIISILFRTRFIQEEVLFAIGYWVCAYAVNYIILSEMRICLYYVILFIELILFLILVLKNKKHLSMYYYEIKNIKNELLKYFIANTILDLYIKIDKSIAFFAEDKLNQDEQDLLGRKMIADSLVDKLIAQEFSESFTVGIIGEWGAGKSQFMSYMSNNIKQNKEIVCFDFSPWTQIHKDKLVVGKYFFEEFGKAYRLYSSALDRELKAFQEKLIDKAPDFHWTGWIVQFFKHIGLGEWFQLDIDRNQINESLKKINRKTVVFVDDFDRLQVEEVVEVLKVIRTTTNFWNTVYVVGVDKTKLEAPLRERLHLPANYLDKFIQLEVHLTPIENIILWGEFRKLLAPFLQSKGLPTYKKELESLSADDVFVSFFGNAMGNMRNIKRLFNMLAFDISSWDLMEFELDFFDFILLSIIKILDIQEYHKIQISHSEAVEKGDIRYSETYNTGLINFIDRHKGNKEFKFYAIAKLWNRRQDKPDFPVRGIQVMKDAYFYEPSILRMIKDDVKMLFTPKTLELGKILEKWIQFSGNTKPLISEYLPKIKAFKFVDLTIARFLEFYQTATKPSLFFEWKKEAANTQFLRFGLQLDNDASMAAYIQFLDFIKKHKDFKALLAAVMGVDPNNTYYKNDILKKQVNIIEYFLDSDENKNIEKLIIIIDAFFDKAKFVSFLDSNFYQKIIKFITDNFDECINCNLFLIPGAEFFKIPIFMREIAKYEGKKPFALLEEMLDKREVQDDFYQDIQMLKNNNPDIINDTGEDEKPYKL